MREREGTSYYFSMQASGASIFVATQNRTRNLESVTAGRRSSVDASDIAITITSCSINTRKRYFVSTMTN
jgi:hypothetical protein